MSPPSPSVPRAILAVLSFLDVAATEGQRRVARERDQGIGRQTAHESELRRDLAELLQRTFKLANAAGNSSPVTAEMEAYHLYRREDIADALAAAWCRQQLGRDAAHALTANYDLSWGGVLARVDLDELANRPGIGDVEPVGQTLKRYCRPGDVVATYRYGGGCGYFVIRGRRLVYDYESIQWQLSEEGQVAILAEIEAFEAAGGIRGFLDEKRSRGTPNGSSSGR